MTEPIHPFNAVSLHELKGNLFLLAQKIEKEIKEKVPDNQNVPVLVLHYLILYVTTVGCYGCSESAMQKMLLDMVAQSDKQIVSKYKIIMIKSILSYKRKKYLELPQLNDNIVQVFQLLYFDEKNMSKAPATFTYTKKECRTYCKMFIPTMASVLALVIDDFNERTSANLFEEITDWFQIRLSGIFRVLGGRKNICPK